MFELSRPLTSFESDFNERSPESQRLDIDAYEQGVVVNNVAVTTLHNWKIKINEQLRAIEVGGVNDQERYEANIEKARKALQDLDYNS